jgi:hypothetical protein
MDVGGIRDVQTRKGLVTWVIYLFAQQYKKEEMLGILNMHEKYCRDLYIMFVRES